MWRNTVATWRKTRSRILIQMLPRLSIAKLMPQLQVFFVIMPLQIVGGLLIFALTLVAVMRWFADSFAAAIGALVAS